MDFELTSQKVVGILDTEFKQMNKSICRATANHGIKIGTVTKERFTKRGSYSIDQMFNKRLTIHHNESRRSPFSIIRSDLVGCYNRIIHTAADLGILRIGIQHARIHSMFSSIQRMVHRIRNDFGDSDIT